MGPLAGGMMGWLSRPGAALYGAVWEARRRAYARGWRRPRRYPTRVVSIGNLTVGGTGKTTLTLHLARRAIERGWRCAVVCKAYRADRAGMSDEAHLYRNALGTDSTARVFVGPRKPLLVAQAAAAGFDLALVDDGFSTWSLERDVDIVLLDARDPWGGGAFLPAGRMREPKRALQRASIVVVSRLSAGEDPGPLLESLGGYAPAALWAAGRHRIRDVVTLAAGDREAESTRVRVVTGTGNPEAVAASAKEAGLEVVALSRYRDHHWFSAADVRRELDVAGRDRAAVLLTEKDAVRWRGPAHATAVRVLRVEWEWARGGDAVERRIWGETP